MFGRYRYRAVKIKLSSAASDAGRFMSVVPTLYKPVLRGITHYVPQMGKYVPVRRKYIPVRYAVERSASDVTEVKKRKVPVVDYYSVPEPVRFVVVSGTATGNAVARKATLKELSGAVMAKTMAFVRWIFS